MIKTLPNWAELFGSLELCDCEHCRSVLSPAAYFVDILKFLQDSESNTVNGGTLTPYDVLVKRRPDLPHIKLTCENTNTPIPYIDLVNEILEYYVAEGKLAEEVAYDTGAVSATELSANPQSTADKIGLAAFHRAYRLLAEAIYPTSLPYHQPLHSMRIYLKHLGTSRSELLKTFATDPDKPSSADYAERLDLSPKEWEILTGKTLDANPTASTITVAELYGATNLVAEVSKVPEFLPRTGIAYVDLVALLKTRSINPAYPLTKEDRDLLERMPLDLETLRSHAPTFSTLPQDALDELTKAGITVQDLGAWVERNKIASLAKLLVIDSPDSTCDLEKTKIQHLDGSDLSEPEWLRIHRFIRLYRKLGWSIAETDLAVRALRGGTVDELLLQRLDIAREIIARLGIGRVDEALSLLADLDVGPDDSVYAGIFLTRAVLDIDPVFKPNPDGTVLKPPACPAAETIEQHVPALVQALRISEADLRGICNDAGIKPANDSLALPNISRLYRYSTLARGLRISVQQLVALRVLSGRTLDTPEDVRDLVADAQLIKDAGWTLDDLNYLFRHVSRAGTDASDNPLDEFELIMNLRTGLAGIASENQPRPDPDGEFTRGRLTLLYGPEIADQTVRMVLGTDVYSAPLASAPSWAAPLSPDLEGRIVYDGDAKELRVIGPLTDAETSDLKARAGTGTPLEKAVLTLSTAPRALIRETLGAFLINPSEAIDTLINVNATAADAKNAVPAKFGRLLDQLLPYCTQRLARTIVRDLVAKAAQLDPDVAAALLETCKSVTGMGRLEDDYLALSVNGLTGEYFQSGQSKMRRTDACIDFAWKQGSPDINVIAADDFSAAWRGWIVPVSTDEYTLTLLANDSATLTINDGSNTVLDKFKVVNNEMSPTDTAGVRLLAGRPYDLLLDFEERTGDASVWLEWRSKSVPRQVIPAERLVPFEPVDDASKATRFLKKVAQLITRQALTADEVRLLSERKETKIFFDPASTPVSRFGNAAQEVDGTATQSGSAAGLFSTWKILVAYTNVRGAVEGGAPALRVLLGDESRIALSMDQQGNENLDPDLVSAFGRDAKELITLIRDSLGAKANSTKVEIRLLDRVRDCLKLARRLGTSASALVSWAAPYPTSSDLSKTAQAIKRVTKAKYDDNTWLTVAKTLSDQLREAQRDALLDYAIARGIQEAESTKSTPPFRTPEQAFEYFLLDVEMSSCMATSRIKQAIGAVQIFVQRCLMNLEIDIHPSQIDGGTWEWMAHYRVWEASRKVFLYPENWIVPSLRPDKTPQFRELESALMQREITNETVERAFRQYLHKVHEIARLEICGIYNEDVDPVTDEAINRLHVFGRTGLGSPHAYYYRRREPEGNWTPWESVQLDIQGIEEEPAGAGVQLIPIVWNRQLYLFWPIYSQKAEQLEIRIAWSAYVDGKWQPKRISSRSLHTYRVAAYQHVFRGEINDFGDLVISFVTDPGVSVPRVTDTFGAFGFSPCKLDAGGWTEDRLHQVVAGFPNQLLIAKPTPSNSMYNEYRGDAGSVLGFFTREIDKVEPFTESLTDYTIALSEGVGRFRIIAPVQYAQFHSQAPFALEHRDGCYFVEPQGRLEWILPQLSNPNDVVPATEKTLGDFFVPPPALKARFNPQQDTPMPVLDLNLSRRVIHPWRDAANALAPRNIGGLVP